MKKKIVKIFLVVALALTAGRGMAQGKHNYTPDDHMTMRDISNLSVSPDNLWIAYTMRNYVMEENKRNSDIYMIPVAGGDPIQLTTSPASDNTPKWSPDNKFLGFLSVRGDSAQVFLLNRQGGDPAQLTDVKQGVDDFEWSPDGKKLALVITDPDPDENDENKDKARKPIVVTRLQFLSDGTGFVNDLHAHIYVFDIAAKTIKQITSGPHDDNVSTPRWSPDGKWIAFSSNRTPDPDTNRNTDIFVVSADGGEPRKLTVNEGTDSEPQWSPDGKTIAYLTCPNPFPLWVDPLILATIPASGGEPRLLTAGLDRRVYDPKYSTDGMRLYFSIESNGTQRLASIAINGADLKENVGVEDCVSAYDVGRDFVAVNATRPDTPNDIFVINRTGEHQLTRINTKLQESVEFGREEKIRYSSKDGTPIEAYVIKPPRFDPKRKYPLIVWPHGGPGDQATPSFNFYGSQIFAGAGYVVLQPNFRGSSGYGVKFGQAIYGDWGNKDYDDIMAGVDYMLSLGYIDPEKLAIGGSSYGALLTDQIITKTHRFKAAVSRAGMMNYIAGYGTDEYQFEWEHELGLPWKKPEAYLKFSPFLHANNVTTPTLVLCGEKDVNVSLLNSEQTYQALRRVGVETMLVVYPGQYHAIVKPSYIKDQYQRWLAWYNHYLLGSPNRTP